MRRTILVCCFAIPILFGFSLAFGSYAISVGNVLQALMNPGGKNLDNIVIWQIRLPRTLIALLSGAGLAVASGVFQSIFRNRLADPAIIGISSAAACGAVVASSISIVSGSLAASALFALISTWLVAYILFHMERRSQISQSLIILGVAINALLMGFVATFAQISSSPQARSFTSWSMGSLATGNWSDLLLIFTGSTIGITLLAVYSRKLDLLYISDVEIIAMGENPLRIKLIASLAAGVMIAFATSTLGVISFLGLLVPNIVKSLGIYLHRSSIYLMALIGAVLLLLSDILARTLIANLELPVSLFLVLFGVPFLVHLILRKQVGA